MCFETLAESYWPYLGLCCLIFKMGIIDSSKTVCKKLVGIHAIRYLT
jgi:hypothetical protein